MPRAAMRSRSSARRACPVRSSWSKYPSPTRLTVHSTPPQSCNEAARVDWSIAILRDGWWGVGTDWSDLRAGRALYGLGRPAVGPEEVRPGRAAAGRTGGEVHALRRGPVPA